MRSGREENAEISKQESKESDFIIRYWAFQTEFGYDDQLATEKQ